MSFNYTPSLNSGAGQKLRAAEATRDGTRPRFGSIDVLRGLIMIVMALDHVRDYFHYGAQHFDPMDLSQTSAALFLTRWITHFCAPTFMLLAGTGAYLQSRRGKSKAEVSRFLLTRGAWLVVLEFTWVLCLGWKMNFAYDTIFLIVIWALGVSMMALAGLIFLPWRVLLASSTAVILLHNTLDGIRPEQFGALSWAMEGAARSQRYSALTEPHDYHGVSADSLDRGHGGGLLLRPHHRPDAGASTPDSVPARRRAHRGIRGSARDKSLWRSEPVVGQVEPAGDDWIVPQCEKYPPSLLYLMMTLGPGLMLLAVFETATGRVAACR